MKKQILRLAFLVIMFVTHTVGFGQGAAQDNNSVENPKEWVASHLDEIHKMTRADWLKLDYTVSKAVLRAFTPEQKVAFWKDKIAETLQLDWSLEERAHIEKLYAWIDGNIEMFSAPSDKSKQDKAQEFFLKWAEEGETKFGWPKQLPLAIAVSGNRLSNKEGDLIPLRGESCGIRQTH